MKKFKRLAAVVIAIAMAAGTSGCANQVNAKGTTPGSEGSVESAVEHDVSFYEVTEPVTIEFWHSLSEEWVNPIVEEFNASQNMITVEALYVGNYAAIREQVAAAQAAGEGLPGLCVINFPQVITYADSGLAEPLDGYMEADEYEDTFYKGFTDPLTVDGQRYAFPMGPSTTVIYYNKDLITESGVSVFPATWEEVQEWAPKFYEATGKTALSYFSTDFNYMNTFMINTGVDPIGDGTKCMMDDEKLVTWVNEMKMLIDQKSIEWINTGSSTETDIKTKFLAGETCAITMSSTYYDKAIEAAEFEVGVALVPENANNNSTTSGATLFIPAENDQLVKNAAYQFMTFLTNDENAKAFALNTAYLPTKSTLLDSEAEVNEFCALYPEMRILYENMDTIISKNPSPYFTKALTAICENLTQIFNAGAEIDNTIASMVEEVDYILSGN